MRMSLSPMTCLFRMNGTRHYTAEPDFTLSQKQQTSSTCTIIYGASLIIIAKLKLTRINFGLKAKHGPQLRPLI